MHVSFSKNQLGRKLGRKLGSVFWLTELTPWNLSHRITIRARSLRFLPIRFIAYDAAEEWQRESGKV